MGVNKVAVGKRIKNIRKMLGLTMEQFGQEVYGANRSVVSNWENGTFIPNNDRLRKIADLGGLTEDELLNGIDKPTNLPEYIQERFNSLYFLECKDIEDFDEYKKFLKKYKMSKGMSNEELLGHFAELQYYKKMKIIDDKRNYLYHLEPKEESEQDIQVLEERVQMLQEQISQLTEHIDLNSILMSKANVYLNGSLLRHADKKLILEVLTPIFEYKKMGDDYPFKDKDSPK